MILAAVFDASRMFEGEGIAIAATGLLIVFAALILITLFIAALPRILEAVAKVLPEVPDRHAAPDASESLLPDEAVLAAIGFVLHHELQKQVETAGTTD
jgi:Na+-transporting methylmalonyl-CoA/oxaloacetate decarboxylase gamma subunit